jgi:nucleotide-binding universal stress UspA family protein
VDIVKQLSRILAAVDFSEPAQAAFDQALALAQAHDAELTVVHAVPPDQSFGWRARARIALIGTLRQRAAAASVVLKVSVQHGDPARVILLHAQARHADLIVLGTHQRTGLGRLRAGSIAERVTVRATQPVLIVPVRSATRALPSFDHVIAAVDFGPASRAALEHALVLTRGTNRRLTAVHVTPGSSSTNRERPSHSSAVPASWYRFGVAAQQRRLTEDAWRKLNSSLLHTVDRGTQVRARVVSGDASAEIARLATEIDADLIVLGVSRRNVVSRTLFGATAARLMRVSEQPILAVPETASATASPNIDQARLAA